MNRFKPGDKVVISNAVDENHGRDVRGASAVVLESLDTAHHLYGALFLVKFDCHNPRGNHWGDGEGTYRAWAAELAHASTTEPAQTKEELVLENQSLLRQIGRMEERLARKREFLLENRKQIASMVKDELRTQFDTELDSIVDHVMQRGAADGIL